MANVIGLKQGDHQVNGRKAGEYYDSCPNADCGKRDIDRQWKIGGGNAKGEQYLKAAIYGCSPADGGCGTTWTRTTPVGVEDDASKGVKSRWGTQAVERGRTVSLPSEAYQRGYEAIDWSRRG